MRLYGVIVELPARIDGCQPERREVDSGFGSKAAAIGFALEYCEMWSGCRAFALECDFDFRTGILGKVVLAEITPEDGVGTEATRFAVRLCHEALE